MVLTAGSVAVSLCYGAKRMNKAKNNIDNLQITARE